MTYEVEHRIVEARVQTSIVHEGELVYAKVPGGGNVDISFPGRLEVWSHATYFVHVDDGEGRDLTERKTITTTLQIIAPDGTTWDNDEVTLDDLRRFRDLRGAARGTWSYRLSGKSQPVPSEGVLLVPGETHVRIRLHETVLSSSALPRLDTTVPAADTVSLGLDLFHVGTLEVSASPGSPVECVAIDDERVAIFVADPAGGVFVAAGSPLNPWGPWGQLPGLTTIPGGNITACAFSDDRIAVLAADADGEVHCAVGNPDQGFGDWQSVSQGATLPGARVCAVNLWAGQVRLFLADPGGGVYTILGKPGETWGLWKPLSDGSSVPGGALSAVPVGGVAARVFVADPLGGVYTAVGAEDDWSGWERIREGSTVPAGVVSGVLDVSGRFRVFLADAGGGVFTSAWKDEPTWIPWTAVEGVRTVPGTPVSVVAHDDGHVRLILADDRGVVRTSYGSIGDGWQPWEGIAEGATMPGGPVVACRHPSGRITIALADRHRGVYAATCPPAGTDWSSWSNVSNGKVGGRTRPVTLRDPDGTVMAQSADGALTMATPLPLLDRSRDPNGGARLWSLDVGPVTPTPTGPPTPVIAQVHTSTRIRLREINDRIVWLLGADGEKIAIKGDTLDGKARLRLTILDRQSAATMDFNDILDPLIRDVEQDDGVGTDLREGTAYNVLSESARLDYGIEIDMDALVMHDLRVRIGRSEHLGAPNPALRMHLGISGDLVVRIADFPLATAHVRGNAIDFELGLQLGPAGEFQPAVWLDNRGHLVDIDVHWAAAVAAAVVVPGGPLTPQLVTEAVEARANSVVADKIGQLSQRVLPGVRHAMARFLGADFDYTSLHVEGPTDDEVMVVSYLAGWEPQPTPSPIYIPVAGGAVTTDTSGRSQVVPVDREDTWTADNLRLKIDHIVMVMMENRSFDHTLGYLAQGPDPRGDGLSLEVVNRLAELGHLPRHLALSGIIPNEVDLKTRFPAPVGHSLAAVTEQLAQQATLGNRQINHPAGFVANFRDRLFHESPDVNACVVADDVLGYYTGADLAFYAHLAANYAWSDRFFCSHPGPTLPNRMLSLVGDVQFTRSGEAVLDNNHGEEFYLSRAMTIFDLLTRRGVDWRVYESFPSVTMLRMFARYAGDRDRIARVDDFATDVLAGNLASFTVIDPAMHHKPQTDDHPVADMYRGQQFLQSIYQALRANPQIWERTLLLITYDEHGGFYDHVVPPVAEILDDGVTQVVTPYGVRVPAFAVSPWVQPGLGPPVVLDHCSILKTVLAKFCGETKHFLTDRVHAAASFESYLTAAAPRMDVPAPPSLPNLPDDAEIRRIVTDPVFRAEMRAGNVDYHNLTGMLARMLGRR